MRKPLEVVKRQVRDLRPYTLRPDRALTKLNQNENPWDTPVEIKDETPRRLRDRQWSRYPDFVPEKLHQRLAEHSGWTSDGIIAGNGSNELIQALLIATVGEGSRVLISEPTFALYRQIATVLGAEIINIPLTPEFSYDTPSLLSAIQSSNPDITIICSPNNPTGCVIPRHDLVSLLRTSTGLVIVDEAYFEFADETAGPLLERYRNLVVLQTFSKAIAMAALRVGYLLAAPELVREIAKAVLPYNLNIVSQIAAEVALEMYKTSLKPQVSIIRSERSRLFAELGRIEGLSPVPSRANFMLVRSSALPSRMYQQLLRRDILIRDLSAYPMLQDCFRVNVGTPEENDQVIAALKEILARKEKAIRAQSS
ncbi:MAG TPA: histidinol-phosphate transaminase [Pyrinomonadaceae bacterium]|nr:histidinol-phosphate transaminase [Pyrinomonadaceae bacterium]